MTPAVTTDDGFEAYVRGVDVVLFPGWARGEAACLREELSSLW
jgi:hypothetical protein